MALKEIDYDDDRGPVLKLAGVDLVDGTPILDIKPYIPYSDAIPGAISGFALKSPEPLEVHWQNQPGDDLKPAAIALIEQSLAIDPRPAYQDGDDKREYGCLIDGYNVRWAVRDGRIFILGYEKR